MKGLILKDLLTVKKQSRIMLILLLFYIGYSIYTKTPVMLGLVTVVFSMMLPITSLAYDEFGKWDRFALSMPIKRSTVVLSKYFLSLLIALCGFVILTPVGLIISKNNLEISAAATLAVMAGSVLLSMLLVAIMLPIIFKLGVEKARLIQMLIIFIPTLFAMLLPELGLPAPGKTTLVILAAAGVLAIIGIYILSIFLSLKIYGKKEF